MKKLIVLLLCPLLIALCFCGCVSVNFDPFSQTVSGTGDREKYDIETGAFTGIKMSSACEIHYYAADKAAATLEIQPNLRAYFSLEVKNGVLVVDSTRKINFSANSLPVLAVYAPALTGLTVEGACTFTAHDKITADSFELNIAGAASGSAELEVNRLSVSLGGAGSFTLTGTADTAQLSLAGAGKLDALSLQTREADVKMDGAGSVRIGCSQTLTVDANGIGSVEYRGSPTVDISKDGLVSVTRVD